MAVLLSIGNDITMNEEGPRQKIGGRLRVLRSLLVLFFMFFVCCGLRLLSSSWSSSGISQEVGRGDPRGRDALTVRDGLEDLGRPRVRVLEAHDGRHVAAAVAVVGRAPHRHQLLVEHVLVA